MGDAAVARRERGGLHLADHLDALRANDLKEVYAFWSGGEAPELPRRELVRQLHDAMTDEGVVYRRVRSLTRKVLDVALLFLRRNEYRSDLPGLFRRVPGEEAVSLEYPDAEAGLRALLRRGFLAESADRAVENHGRAVYAIPVELGELLVGLFREETRSVRGVFSLAGHLATLGGTARAEMRARFPALPAAAGASDARTVVPRGTAAARVAAIEPPALRALVERTVHEDGGILLRSEAAGRLAPSPPWDRKGWAKALEAQGVGTVARLSLGDYGIVAEDEALVVFAEVLEDLLAPKETDDPGADEVLRAGADLVADLSSFLAQVRRHPLRMTREGDVHRAARRRVEDAFVFRESVLAGPAEVWAEIRGAADRLHLVDVDAEGFLVPREEAERWTALHLEEKVAGLYRLALESPGPRGRSLHQCELRGVVEDLLKESPRAWWGGDSLFVAARLRYLASLDARRIRDRHRDRHFSAYVSGGESLRDLLADLAHLWRRRLHLLGVIDVALVRGEPAAVRLSALGARVLGVAAGGDGPGRCVIVSPDFEAIVLPEGDVSEVVHALDGFAQRVKTGDVVHFRFTRESIEAATAEGRAVGDLLAFLAQRARGEVPGNVAVSLRAWAEGVGFARVERGFVLHLASEDAAERVARLPAVQAVLVRRISPLDLLLREDPVQRKVLAALRTEGVYVRTT